MDISQFNCDIVTVEKNKLFYNQYCYSGKFYLSELGVIRGLDRDKIDSIVAYRNSYRSSSYSFQHDKITPKNVEHLKIVCDILSQYRSQLKFVVSYNRGHVYTNNLEVLQQIRALSFIHSFSIHQVDVTSAADCITLINPRWAYRTYFRSLTLTEHQRDALVQYLESRQNIKLSRGLKSWCRSPKKRWWDLLSQSYFFVEHNDNGEMLFLNMVVPRITNKTFRLVAK
jgi:hypothetical protein